MKTAERIRLKATERRTVLNDEMSVVAEALKKSPDLFWRTRW